MIALDTNLLIYAHRAAVPEHRGSRRAIERACNDARGCGVALPTLGEFWSVVTHPAQARPSTPEQATEFIERLVSDGGVQLWEPGLGFAGRLLHMATDLRVGGARIFDLQIAVIAFENGAREIWTHDQGFALVPGLRRVDPLSAA